MHNWIIQNWIIQVLWPDRGAAGEDMPGAGGGIEVLVGWVYCEGATACGGGLWLRWNTFTLHGNSINISGMFIGWWQ